MAVFFGFCSLEVKVIETEIVTKLSDLMLCLGLAAD